MLGHRVAEIVGVGNDVQHALGEDVLDQFGEFQRRQRRGRRGFHHQRVAGEQGRRQFEAEDQQRIVPGNDGADDAERTAMGFDAAVAAVLDHFHRQVERGEIAEEGGHAHDFAGGVGERFALFAGQDARQFVGIGFDGIGHLGHELAALRDRGRRPGRKSRLGRGNRGIELGFRSARALHQHFFGRGIEDGHLEIAGHHFPVDEKIEFTHRLALPLNGPRFRSRYIHPYITYSAARLPGRAARQTVPETGLDGFGKSDIF